MPTELNLPGILAIDQKYTIREIRKLFSFPVKNFDADNFIKLTLQDQSQIDAIMKELNNDSDILYAQPNHVFQLDFIPNDAAFPAQWPLLRIKAPAGWDLTRGDSTIVIGIIDTGVDYNHEDLQRNIWINPGEDLNRDNVIDAADFNGVDDDDNGFIDDLRGWDFTDAPNFPDGGDYLNRDNDPMDEHTGSHGTRVAGIVGAVTNNGIGIAGVAPGCRIMPLRAGTSQGLLEEEDVASAVLYAINNGVRILNMSFGDTEVSRLFTDIIRYAYENNCILIASAGNSGSDEVHYPSGYDETISVAATDSADYLAGFSNYGTTIDVCAPGVAVLSTERSNLYSRWSGTSAAAPYVSGLAGLLLSQNPHLNNEDIKGILTTSADDPGTPGWDRYYGAGRINIARALQQQDYSTARIYSPAFNEGFSAGPIRVLGTAYSPSLKLYSLSFGFGANPTDWHPIAHINDTRVIEDELAIWEIQSLPDSIYTLRLQLENGDGTFSEDKVMIVIDRTPPILNDVNQLSMWDGDRPAVLVQFHTDDICTAALLLKHVGSDISFQVPLDYQTQDHRILLTQEIASDVLAIQIAAKNRSGLETIFNDPANLKVDLSELPIGGGQFAPLLRSLPAGYLLNKSYDFDGDRTREIIVNEYKNNTFDRLKIYKLVNDAFAQLLTTFGLAIPRDLGDGDLDGKMEILIGAGRVSYILESEAADKIPTQIVWMDSMDFWASRYADLDSDNQPEIIARVGNVFTIWENTSDNQYQLVDSLVNFTPGSNVTGVPHCEVGDFDGDGRREILLGDYDGDIYIYESSGNNNFIATWQARLPLMDSIDFIASGDYDGDGLLEFAAGCHSDPTLDAEHEYDARHWLYRIYDQEEDNSYRITYETRFFGFEAPKDFDSGVSSGDVDNDGRDELLVNVFPDFYIIDYDPGLLSYRPIWHYALNRSNAVLVADLDGNTLNEFYFNTGSEIIGFESIQSESRLAVPNFVDAFPLDSTRVQLTWKPVPEARGYRIYRGLKPTELIVLDSVKNPPLIDSLLESGTEYFYSVTTLVQRDQQILESQFSKIAGARPGPRPYVAGARPQSVRSVRITFSEPMAKDVLNRNAYRLNDLSGMVASVAMDKSGCEVLLTASDSFSVGVKTKISVFNVSDLDRVPIDSTRNHVFFQYDSNPTPPYLVASQYISNHELHLIFNEPMDPVSCSNVANFSFRPDIRIEEANLIGGQGARVHLRLKSDVPMGALGRNYSIQVTNVANLGGQKIRPGRGDRLVILLSRQNLDQVFTYPNPFRPDLGRSTITFANLTPRATVKILTLNGQVIRVLEERDGNGGVDWDLKDENGHEMASGIYLFYIEGNGDRKTGKFAIIR